MDTYKVIVTNKQDNKVLLEYLTKDISDAELVTEQFRTVKESTGIQITVALYYPDGEIDYYK